MGVASVSGAAIFIRLADAEPLTVAAHRLLLGAVFVSIPTLLRDRAGLRALRRADMPLLALSSAFLAAHFAVWTISLSLTSVASSSLLVTTTPVFVAIGSHLVLREHVERRIALAIALSLGGGAFLALGEWEGARRLSGDLLALTGAVAVGGYLLIGRRMRGHISNLPYVTVVYGMGAVPLLIAAAISGAPLLGIPLESYFWIAMAALFPQAIGHSLLNWALGHLPATNVTLTVRGEPIIATLVAIPVLGETPGWAVLPGGVLVMAGVWLAIQATTEGRENDHSAL